MTSIRDPLWNTIVLDDVARRLIDTPVFQRLRYVRQLGLAHLVYPGATHTRFEHALGAYHLARRTIAVLDDRHELDGAVAPDERGVVTAAALLHDVGHHPFSHALEEIGAQHHEVAARPLITHGPIADELRASIAHDAPERVYALIRGENTSPLQGLISGSLDLDKIEYLKRDAFMCGVPYGEIDVDRLINALTVIRGSSGAVSSRTTIGVRDKGLSALESLLFAKYQMYRNVYWHHAVRSATAMYKRLVDDAIRDGALDERALSSLTDEGLLHVLETTSNAPLLDALRNRRLYKRAFECAAGDLPDGVGDWIAVELDRVRTTEDALARQLGLAPGELLLDFPEKPQMLGLDLPVRLRGGQVHRLTREGLPGSINLPALSDELYRSARVLRVFVARPVLLGEDALRAVLA